MRTRLQVNVDHVATVRQARGTDYPDPVEAALRCEWAGAHGITVHLREDRRHIQDDDVRRLRAAARTRINLEMACTEEMIGIAIEVKPDVVTLVPEKREERTTEGGLDCVGQLEALKSARARLAEVGIPMSLFIDPEEAQIRAAKEIGAWGIELHTGDYADAKKATQKAELNRLAEGARFCSIHAPTLHIAAGHGLTAYNTPSLVAAIPEVVELNIGHALVADAIVLGIEGAVGRYLRAIEEGERERAQ